MQATQTREIEQSDLPAELICHHLPVFDPADLESVRSVFQSATSCPFQQAWLPEPESGFAPGVVRLGWTRDSLLVFAELTDNDIFNTATKPNERTWELGDVFEMFFKSAGQASYIELHVTPHNQWLQLRYPDDGAVVHARKEGVFDKFLIRDKVFHSKTWVLTGANRWLVYAEIPARAVCGSDQLIEPAQWRFSFGRCDYTRGVVEPVISSTSSHTMPDFHRQQEWGVMTFSNSL
jgi:hypothetical protein